MSPNPTGLTILKIGLRVFEMKGWGVAFATYWSTTTWLPSGVYTGGLTTNGIAQGAKMQLEIEKMLKDRSIKSSDDFADRIASMLSTYTTGLIVQATLSIPPNTKPETVI